MDDPSDEELADMVVEATDLRDVGRVLIARADRLYEKVIDVALAIKYPPIRLEVVRRAVKASEEEQI